MSSKLRYGTAICAVCSVIAGCVVDVALEGKRCPCAEGWTCDTATETCTRDACIPAFGTETFIARWATANQVLWTWETTGDPSRFLRYELRVAESEEDLLSGSGTTRVFDASTNPELAGATTRALTRGLDPSTTYYGRLVAIDDAECAQHSGVVGQATGPTPQGGVEIFRDELVAGGAPRPQDEMPPQSINVVPDADGEGAHLAYVARDDEECVPPTEDWEDVRAVCGQPIGIWEMSLEASRDPSMPQLDRLEESTFGGAFLELALSIEAPVDVNCHSVWLRTASCPTEDCRYLFESFVVPATSTWQIIQVPLREMTGGPSGTLAYADLDVQAGGAPITELAISCDWHKTSTIRIDDVVLAH